ncbi:GDP-mannose transporter [Hondaea fermentalgiana]|uniref:GDP-mannose transporter n=1 Tax=Hondaea fermentalgiana TaxID=2315210 RepID=A0A2R5FYK8_9STRA|nr:GDP-mannose transporter [Hondaea fermentalgiana]|eukprot:GBG23810.1 GDP-mannose transporter [Hondaea fermentalgiana]
MRGRSSSSVTEAGFGEAELDNLMDGLIGPQDSKKDSAPRSKGLAAWLERLKMLCGTAVLSCLIYSTFSIGMTLVNKVILTTYHFHHHMVLLLYQNAMSVLLLQFARWMGWVQFASLQTRQLIAWIPLNFLFVGMLLTSFFSLNLLSVPMATIFKNSTNILITMGDYVFYGRRVSQGIAGSLGLMFVGAVLAGRSDLEFNTLGYFWAACNCAITAAYVLYMPRAMADSKLNAFGRVYYNNLLSLPLVMVTDLVVTSDIQSMFQSFDSSPSSEITGETDYGFIATVLVSGCIGFFLSLSSFQCVQSTSPTTYAMVGAMNKIPLAIIGIIMFNTQLNSQSVIFISISLAAGTLYAYSKSKLGSPVASSTPQASAATSKMASLQPGAAKLAAS